MDKEMINMAIGYRLANDRFQLSGLTTSAKRFLASVCLSWQSSPEPWDLTAERGLADVDAEDLATMCDESGDDYAAAEAEVLHAIRASRRTK